MSLQAVSWGSLLTPLGQSQVLSHVAPSIFKVSNGESPSHQVSLKLHISLT